MAVKKNESEDDDGEVILDIVDVPENEEENYKESFVWIGTRIGLAINIFLGVLTLFGIGFQTVNLFYVIVVLGTFVLSIIHLTKYKEKAVAIVALVLTSLRVLALAFLLFVSWVGLV